jgi:hypothetical protein
VVDRGSTFASSDVVSLLKNKVIPVALDHWYEIRRPGGEGDFYRKVVAQGPRGGQARAAQGIYTINPDGKLLGFSNRTDPEVAAAVKRQLEEAIAKFHAVPAPSFDAGAEVRPPPEGGLVVKVVSKVLGGWAPTEDFEGKIFQNAMGRDFLWVRKDEAEALARGELARSLLNRMARFNLLDGTRGEPGPWGDADLKKVDLRLSGGTLEGPFAIQNGSGTSGFEGDVLGFVKAEKGKVVRFDVVAKGQYWGATGFSTEPPKGRFPFAVAFTLTDAKAPADRLPPQGARDWGDYIR